ncbi:phosphomannomutase 2-like protein, partial [Euroglyphus maynei]
MSSKEYPRTLVLFDVDGTLTRSRMSITAEMEEFLLKLKEKVDIGLVGGSDIAKIAEQMTTIDCGCDSFTVNPEEQITKLINKYDYIFAENGLLAYHHGQQIGKQSIIDELGEERIQRFINFALGYLSRLKIPVKRGTFIEFRNGLINVSPIGRSCSRDERNNFYQYDQQHGIRSKMIDDFRKEFDGTDIEMDYVIG